MLSKRWQYFYVHFPYIKYYEEQDLIYGKAFKAQLLDADFQRRGQNLK